MKISEAIEKLRLWHEPFVESKNGGRDKVLAGDPEQECTGIAITVCATMDVLKKAKEKNINLIISHESIFFGGRVEAEGNDIYEVKKQYIEENGIVVYRDHDRMHGNGLPFHPNRVNPDYIFYGICKELGWEEYIVGDTLKPVMYEIPKTSAQDLAQFLMDKFHLKGLRIVGNMDCDITKVWFCEHVQGDSKDSEKVAKGLQAEAMIPFEICDFTLTQYVVDAASMGQSKVLMEMGHFNAEELGMKYMLAWINEAVGEDIRAEFIQSGDLFQYINNDNY